MTVKVIISLGFVKVEIDNFGQLLRGRGRVRDDVFVVIGRFGDLALDTGSTSEAGAETILWSAHAGPPQLWRLERARYRGEYFITSVANGLVLDARTGCELGRHPLMWPRHGEPHQRWRLHPTPDGAAFIVESVLTGHVLDIDADSRERPQLWERHGAGKQQVLLFRRGEAVTGRPR